jgi:hypothetical protein
MLKRSLRFKKKKVHPLRPRFDVFGVPKRERSAMTSKKIISSDFSRSGNEN